MANLAALLSRRKECESRGQLILVTAFALAALLLGLAIIVNSAIFTENLATRSENVESTEALEYRHGVTQFTGDTIEFANEYNHSSHETIRENVSDGALDIGEYTSIQQVEGGAAVSLDLVATENGTRIFQNDDTAFTNETGEPDWTVASGIERTRAFEIQITEPPETDTFSVVANDTDSGDTEWRMDISEESSDEYELTVNRPDAGFEETCVYEREGDRDTIDITGATVNGNTCPALIDTEAGEPMQFGAGVGEEYAIEFEGGDNINGSYSLIVSDGSDGGVSGIDDKHYAPFEEAEGGPYNTPAMYSATLELDYETSRVEYRTAIRVAPGEPR